MRTIEIKHNNGTATLILDHIHEFQQSGNTLAVTFNYMNQLYTFDNEPECTANYEAIKKAIDSEYLDKKILEKVKEELRNK